MTNVKDVILKLREVQKEKKLSYDKILSMMEGDGEFTSKSTLSRLFGNNWENYSFDYERTILPIANVLLDIDTVEENDDVDTQAYKAVLKLKRVIIEGLEEKIKTVEDDEKAKYHAKLEKETEKFQSSLDFMSHQIELKDKRIDQLMDANDRLSIMNNRMLEQFLNCPLKGKGCQNEG